MDTRFQGKEGKGRGCFERTSRGCTLGLETGAPSRLTSLRATWAWCSRGESAQPLLQWRSGE